MQQEHGLGRHTVRKAVGMLRAEGLVSFVKGLGMVVREDPEFQVLAPPPGAEVRVRMPSAAERDEFGLEEGVPVFVIVADDGVQVFPGDRWVLRLP